MSKVISFSISDKYLEKLRTLYPALTDNLAAKQFLTDGLESSLGNSLDGSLDAELDGKLKSLIESELDDLLDERLDATVGKLITSLSERIERIEKRLDTNLDGRLDDMERLLKLQRESSIASPLPPIEETSPLPPSPPDRPAIDSLPGDTSPIESVTGEGMNPNQAHEYLKKRGIEDTSYYYLNKWAKTGVIDTSPQGKNAIKHLILRDKLYFPKTDQP